MAYKPLNDWLDKHEGKKEGSSYENIQKERVRQGYKREDVKKKMAKKMGQREGRKKIVYDDYSPIKKGEIAHDDPRVARTLHTSGRLQVLKNVPNSIRSLHDMPGYKSTMRHINKVPELRGKANYFAHLDERARRRGEQDL
jgi:hypothetical protein